MSNNPNKIIDFYNILTSEHSPPQNLSNVIAGHVQTTLSNLSEIFKKDFNGSEEEIKASIIKSFQNLQEFFKTHSTELNYYSRVLKSKLLLMCFSNSFSFAETKLFPFISSITIDDSDILKTSLQEVYLCALSNFSNSIGSKKFVDCQSNIDSINHSLKLLNLLEPNDIIRKLFQRSFTRNGFIIPFSHEGVSQELKQKFDVKDRFDFDQFVNIFSKRTGRNASNFNEAVTNLLNATNDTPLLFLNRFRDSNKVLDTDKNQSFISSPPLAYERLIIDKLAIFCDIPVEIKKVQKYYILLIAANLRFKEPLIQIPYIKYYKLLNIKARNSMIPFDVAIRGTCKEPFYYSFKGDENENEDDLITDQQQEILKKSFYTDIIDGLHPIEVQLARILEFSSLYNFQNSANYKSIFNDMFNYIDDNTNITQIKVSRSLISLMLFPDTKVELCQKSTDLFILSVFAELYKLLKSSKIRNINQDDFIAPGKVRRVFQLAMNGIIPSVYQNIVKLADWTQESQTNKDFDEPEDDKFHTLYPFSYPLLLKKFLVDPNLRRKCPVIYAYLRLHSRFSLTKHIPVIAKMLSRIWDKYAPKKKDDDEEEEEENNEEEDNEDKYDKTFADIKINYNDLKEFFQCWKRAVKLIDYGSLTEKARMRLDDSYQIAELKSKEDLLSSSIRTFLPYEPGAWPGLIVLESLSRAHNEFISILQQHSKIHTFNVTDKSFNKSKSLNDDVFRQFFSVSVREHLGPDCLPVFNEEIEKKFIEQAEVFSYYYILHPMINFAMKEEASMSSKGLVTLFEEMFDTIDLTEEQKKMLQIHIKENDKSAGALLLLNKFMFFVLDDHNSSGSKDFMPTTTLSSFIEKSSIQKTPIENESYSALLIAKGKLKDEFKVGQFSKMYSFLSEPIDSCKKAFSLQEAIIQNVIVECAINEKEIDNIQLQNVVDYRPYFTVIPKIFADMLNKKLISYNNKTLAPKQVIDLWNSIDDKERMLIDRDEAAVLDEIIKLDEGKNNNKLVTLISYFNDAKVNYKW